MSYDPVEIARSVRLPRGRNAALAALAAAIAIAAAATAAVIASAGNGAAAQVNPIQIGTRTDLEMIGTEASHPLNGNYILTADIDLGGSATPWIPIGQTPGGGSTSFTGTLDGDGRTITGLYINTNYGTSGSGVGLFARLGGTVRNLNIDQAVVIDTTAGGGIRSRAGAVAGNLDSGQVINVHVTNSVVGGDGRVGGIAGLASGSISASSAEVTIIHANSSSTTDGFVQGGLFGGGAVTVQNSYARITVRGNYKLGALGGDNQVNATNSYGTIDASDVDAAVTNPYDRTELRAAKTNLVALSNWTDGISERANTVGTTTNSYWAFVPGTLDTSPDRRNWASDRSSRIANPGTPGTAGAEKGDTVAGGAGLTTPTSATGIYAAWTANCPSGAPNAGNPIWDFGTNSDLPTITCNIAPTSSVTAAPAAPIVVEGQNVPIMVTRTGTNGTVDITIAETTQFGSFSSSSVERSATVTIQNGASSATEELRFYPTDDSVFMETRTAMLTATGSRGVEFPNGNTFSVMITDNDFANFTVTPAESTIEEGENTTLTIRRTSESSNIPATVTLEIDSNDNDGTVSDHDARLQLSGGGTPQTTLQVTFNTDEDTAEVILRSTEDSNQEVDNHPIRIKASASTSTQGRAFIVDGTNRPTAEVLVNVTDDDVPAFGLFFEHPTFQGLPGPIARTDSEGNAFRLFVTAVTQPTVLPAGDVTVNIDIIGGSGSRDDIDARFPRTITIARNQAQGDINQTIVADGIQEGVETIRFRLRINVGDTPHPAIVPSNRQDVVLTIVASDQPDAVVSVARVPASSTAEVPEGGFATYRITRDRLLPDPDNPGNTLDNNPNSLSLDLASNLNAGEPNIGEGITFQDTNGNDITSITLPILPDLMPSNSVDFRARLDSNGAEYNARRAFTITVDGDDVRFTSESGSNMLSDSTTLPFIAAEGNRPTFQFGPDTEVNEDAGTVDIPLTTTGTWTVSRDADLTLSIASGDADDLGTLPTIQLRRAQNHPAESPNQDSTFVFTVPITDDTDSEGQEQITFNLAVTGTGSLGPDTQFTLTINDNDLPNLAIAAAGSDDIGDEGRTANIAVEVTNGIAAADTAFTLTPEGGAAQHFTIPAGQSRFTAAITIPQNSVNTAGATPPLTFTLAADSGAATVESARRTHGIMVRDNDIQAISVEGLGTTASATEGSGVRVTVSRVTDAAVTSMHAVSFNVGAVAHAGGPAPDNDLEFPSRITIPAGVSQVAFFVTATQDTIEEQPRETFRLRFVPVGSGTGVANDDPANTFTAVDDDAPTQSGFFGFINADEDDLDENDSRAFTFGVITNVTQLRTDMQRAFNFSLVDPATGNAITRTGFSISPATFAFSGASVSTDITLSTGDLNPGESIDLRITATSDSSAFTEQNLNLTAEAAELPQYRISVDQTTKAEPNNPANLMEDPLPLGQTVFTFTVDRPTSGNPHTAAAGFNITVDRTGTTIPASVTPGAAVLSAPTVSFAAGDAAQTFTLTVAGDLLYEEMEGYRITLTPMDAAAYRAPAAIPVSVTDNDVPRFGIADRTRHTREFESHQSIPVAVEITNGVVLSEEFTVDLNLRGTQFMDDIHPDSHSTTYTFAPGAAPGADRVDLRIAFAQDNLYEGVAEEVIDFDLQPPRRSRGNQQIGTLETFRSQLTVELSDSNMLSLRITDDPRTYNVQEGGSASITVGIDPNGPATAVDIPFTITIPDADGDLTGSANGMLAVTDTITAGQRSIILTVPIFDDATPEEEEDFTVTLSGGGPPRYPRVTVDSNRQTANIVVARSEFQQVNATGLTPTVNEGANLSIQVQRTGTLLSTPITYGITVTGAAGEISLPNPATAILAAGGNAQTFNLGSVVDDTFEEAAENFTITLSPQVPFSADDITVMVTVSANDTPAFSFIGPLDPGSVASRPFIAENSTENYTFGVTNGVTRLINSYTYRFGLAAVAGSTLQVDDMTVLAGTNIEFTFDSTSDLAIPVEFLAGAVNNNTQAELNVFAQGGAPAPAIDQILRLIQDIPAARFTFTVDSRTQDEEDGAQFTFTVARPAAGTAQQWLGAATFDVAFSRTAGDGLGGGTAALSGITNDQITFPAGGAAGDTQQFTLTVPDDQLQEAAEQYTVTIMEPADQTTQTTYRIAPQSIPVTVTDDDAPQFRIRPTSIPQPITEGTTSTVGTVTAEVEITNGKELTAPVTIDFNLALAGLQGAGQEDDIAPGSRQNILTFMPGETEASVEIGYIQDNLFERTTEAFRFVLANPSIGTVMAGGTEYGFTITDDEQLTLRLGPDTGLTVNEGDDAAITASIVGSTALGIDVDINLALATGGDAAEIGTFTPDAVLTQMIRTFDFAVPITDDNVGEAEEVLNFILTSGTDRVIVDPAANSVAVTIPENDRLTITLTDLTGSDAAEEGAAVSPRLTPLGDVAGSNRAITYDITVRFDDGATQGGVESPEANLRFGLPRTYTLPANQAAVQFSPDLVNIVENTVQEPTKRYFFTLTPQRPEDGDAATFTVEVEDNDDPTFGFITMQTAILETITEGGFTQNIEFGLLSGATALESEFQFRLELEQLGSETETQATIDGHDASNDQQRTITIGPGNDAQALRIPVRVRGTADDNRNEDNTTVTVNVRFTGQGDPPAISPIRPRVVITDVAAPAFAVAITGADSGRVTNEGIAVTFTLTRPDIARPHEGQANFNLAVARPATGNFSDRSNATLSTQRVNFAANSNAPQSFTLTFMDDNIQENLGGDDLGDVVEVSITSAAPETYVAIPETIRITNLDQADIPTYGIRGASAVPIDETNAADVIRAAASSVDLREGATAYLLIGPTNGIEPGSAAQREFRATLDSATFTTDVRRSAVPVSFLHADAPESRTISVAVFDDDDLEGAERITYTLGLAAGASADTFDVDPEANAFTLNVAPSDPRYGFTEATADPVQEGQVSTPVTLNLTRAAGADPGEEVRANLQLGFQAGVPPFASFPGGAETATVTFNSGNATAQATLNIIGNNFPNTQERVVTVNITSVEGGDAELAANTSFAITVTDDDRAQFRVLSILPASEGENFTVNIIRTNFGGDAERGFPVDFNVDITEGLDQLSANVTSTIRVAANTPSGSRAYRVDPDNEREPEDQEVTFTVSTDNPDAELLDAAEGSVALDATIRPPSFSAAVSADSVQRGRNELIIINREAGSSQGMGVFELSITGPEGGSPTGLTLHPSRVQINPNVQSGFSRLEVSNPTVSNFTLTATPQPISGGAEPATLAGGTPGTGALDIPLRVAAGTQPTLRYEFRRNAEIINEGETIGVTVRLRRDATAPGDIIIPLTFSGADTVNNPTSVAIPAGQNQASFVITSVDDDTHSGRRLISVTLGQAEGSASPYEPGSVLTVSVNDDEPATPVPGALQATLTGPVGSSVSEVGSVKEGDDFNVAIFAPASATVGTTPLRGRVLIRPQMNNFASAGTPDITGPDEYEIMPGETTTLTFTVIDDMFVEANEAYQIEFIPIDSNHTFANSIVTIYLDISDALDRDHSITLAQNSDPVREGNLAEFIITRPQGDNILHPGIQEFTVQLSITDDPDNAAVIPNSTVSFRPDQAEARFSVFFPDNNLPDPARNLQLSLVNHGGFPIQTASFELPASDGRPQVGFIGGHELTEREGATAEFTIGILNPQDALIENGVVTAIVQIDQQNSTADIMDFTGFSGAATYSFRADAPTETLEIMLTTNTDNPNNVDETLALEFTNILNGGTPLAGDLVEGENRNATLTITPAVPRSTGPGNPGNPNPTPDPGGGNPAPPVEGPNPQLEFTVEASASTVQEGQSFEVALSRAEFGTELEINIFASGDVDDVTFPGTVTIGENDRSAEFTVMALTDTDDEGVETISFSFSAEDGEGNEATFDPSPISIGITDSELQPNQTYSIFAATREAGPNAVQPRITVFRGGSAFIVIQRPDGAPSGAITFNITITGSGGATPSQFFADIPSSITIPSGADAGGAVLQTTRSAAGQPLTRAQFTISAVVTGGQIAGVPDTAQVTILPVPLPSTGAPTPATATLLLLSFLAAALLLIPPAAFLALHRRRRARR